MEYGDTEKQMLREVLPGIAVQLRGALANIHGALGRLAPEQLRDRDNRTDHSAAILCQSYYQILRVVNNLSDAPMLAEDKPFDTENVELVELLDGLSRQGQVLAELLDLNLSFTCRDRAHVIAANRELLERLFWNLVSNAMKFTPSGGTIEVSLRTGPDCVLLCVKDSGPGIPADKLERLFDRWQHSSMDLPVHGLGLGLPLCRRIAQGHGGSLMVSSRQGEGTAVTVRLPDRRSGVTLVRQPPFHYAGGFNPVLVELADALPPADTVTEADYRSLVILLAESRRAIRTQEEQRYGDMVDYYTMWAHQIKTPIASMRLTLQNEDSDLARSLSGDLMRVEQYVEMVMVFLRLGSTTTDYVIRAHSLDDIVRPAVRKFAGEFIRRRLRLDYQPLDRTVVTDAKWLGFVVEQVLSNALKYTAHGSVTIAMDGNDLCIRDTGMGIAPEDLPRIFDRGFTGLNGRRDTRASGIGLYLCRRICRSLGHTIRASSVPGQGTEIRIGLGRKKTLVE